MIFCWLVFSFIFFVFSLDNFRSLFIRWSWLLVLCKVIFINCCFFGFGLFFSNCCKGFIMRVSGVWNLWERLVKNLVFRVLSFLNCFFFLCSVVICLNKMKNRNLEKNNSLIWKLYCSLNILESIFELFNRNNILLINRIIKGYIRVWVVFWFFLARWVIGKMFSSV